ncbi:MAG: hypothetical protein J6Q53_04395 [Oscillospiraceae bacterium]|nr:hypothetical protein [Oscillospiraceae bacterium]
MKYALNLGEDGRVLSITYEEFAPENAVLVDSFPKDDVSDYRYVDGDFIHDPLPVPEEKPSQMDILEAQVTYTAMMTDTLLEV